MSAARDYVGSYLRLVDDDERKRREAIAAWRLAEDKRARRRKSIAIAVAALPALAALLKLAWCGLAAGSH